MLANLLSNARKHTEPGTTVTTAVKRTNDGTAIVTVTDNGTGIAPEFVDRVFRRFARADASAGTPLEPRRRPQCHPGRDPRHRRPPWRGRARAPPPSLSPVPAATAEGTSGLGLSIVQAIVEAHGGTVHVTSRPGRTQFAVRLPEAAPAT